MCFEPLCDGEAKKFMRRLLINAALHVARVGEKKKLNSALHFSEFWVYRMARNGPFSTKIGLNKRLRRQAPTFDSPHFFGI